MNTFNLALQLESEVEAIPCNHLSDADHDKKSVRKKIKARKVKEDNKSNN